MELYRYMAFETFVDIVQSERLTFVSPLFWEDKYEGYLYRAMKTSDGKRQVNQIINDMGGQNISCILQNDNAVSLTKAQCWSKSRDFVPMWSIYSYNSKAIMIQTKKEKLEELKGPLNSNVSVEPVEYIDNLSLKKEICLAINGNTLDMSKIFQTKRKAFEHENEMRAFVGGAVDNTDQETYSLPIHVKVDDIMDFIEDVLVHPNAPGWYVKIVETFCDNHCIRFSGKSKLYEFELK